MLTKKLQEFVLFNYLHETYNSHAKIELIYRDLYEIDDIDIVELTKIWNEVVEMKEDLKKYE